MNTTKKMSLRQIAQQLQLDAFKVPRDEVAMWMQTRGFVTPRNIRDVMADEPLRWVHRSDGRAALVQRVQRGETIFVPGEVEQTIQARLITPQGISQLTDAGLALVCVGMNDLSLAAMNTELVEFVNANWLALAGHVNASTDNTAPMENAQ